ncbi:hypothetical protein FZC84_11335 [Rossellomorea vietnamensis]|uniref:Uncharacterized protein n=1 Tax=Rossellomorea vietnamensis TaxID=218284 RepID=A0A5D4MCX5_9BACI|nr:hypothetical protein [Rossellomorea vietnamensis]TYR99338.1 hypothetical protein FZC84_11335 [Rossellomorea vietnamensis]
MKEVNGYKLPLEVLDSWKEKFVPKNEILFFREAPDFLPSEKYLPETSQSFSLDERTSFTTWAVSREARYFAKINTENILKLNEGQRKKAIKEQRLLQRGMTFTEKEVIQLLDGVNYPQEVLKVLEPSSFVDEAGEEKVYMLQHYHWNSLSSQVQTQFLLNYAELWTDEKADFENLDDRIQHDLKEEYHSLSSFIDTFPSKNGPNCLSAAAAGFTADIKIIEDWMKPDRFHSLLNHYGYTPIDNAAPQKGDVLVWRDEHQRTMHACFLLNDQYSFNKHGQTMFNPWQVLPVEEVMNVWNSGGFSMQLHRKEQD